MFACIRGDISWSGKRDLTGYLAAPGLFTLMSTQTESRSQTVVQEEINPT